MRPHALVTPTVLQVKTPPTGPGETMKDDARSRGKVTRRDALLLAGATIAVTHLTPSGAFGQGWRPQFDAGDVGEASVLTAHPILTPDTVGWTEAAIATYRTIVEGGGWPTVPEHYGLGLGVADSAVPTIRARLIASHDLLASLGQSDVFDSYVDAAVRRFQARHGIPADGIVGEATVAAMNISVASRLRQLEDNLLRLTELVDAIPSRFVFVNLPGAQIEAVEAGQVISRHAAVVGRVDRPSPILTSEIHEINFNPFWTIPVSIIERDLIPLMQREPDYLTHERIRIYDQGGREIDPYNVDWYSGEATRYMFRQDPGGQNALGSVRLNFPNPHSVYLHDTPDKTLFRSDYRFESSGCVRVKDVRELVIWLLRDTPGWARDRIEAVFNSGDRVNARIENPAKLYLAYITAWGSPAGVVQFRSDIYGRDGIGDPTM